MAIIITASKLPRRCFLCILVNIINIYGVFRMAGVQVPEYLALLCRQCTVECLNNRILMMQVNFRCNPHAVRVTADFLKRRSQRRAAKYNDLFFEIRIRPSDNQRRIVFVLRPSALAPEDMFQTKAVLHRRY